MAEGRRLMMGAPHGDAREESKAALLAPARPFSWSARGASFVRSRRRHLRQQVRHAQQVIGGADEVDPEAGPLHPAIARLAQAADHLPPAEDLLDLLAAALAHPVAGMAQR